MLTTSTSTITTPVTTILAFNVSGNFSAVASAGVPTSTPPSAREDSGAAEAKPKSVPVSGAPGAAAPGGVTRAPGDLTLSSHVYQVTSGTPAAPGAILSPTEEGVAPSQLPASLTPALPVPLGGPTLTPPAGGQGAPVLQNVFRDSTNDGKVNLLPSGEVEGGASLGHQGSSRPHEAPTPYAAAATLPAPLPAAPDKEFASHTTPSSFSSTSTPTSSYVADRTTAAAGAAATTTPSPLTAAPTPGTSVSISSSSSSSPSSSSSSSSSSSPPIASEEETSPAPPSSLITASPGTLSTSSTPSLSPLSSPSHSSTTPPPPVAAAEATTTTTAARDNAAAFAQPFPDEALKPGHFGANNTSIRGSHGGSGANHNQDAVMPNPRAGRVISHKAEPLQKENPAPKRGNQEPSRFKEEEIKEGEGGGGEGVEGSNERQREGDEARHSSQPQHPQDTPRTQAGHVAQPATVAPPPPPRGRLSHYPQNTHDDFNSSRPSDGSLSRHDPSEQRDGPSVVSQDSGRGKQGDADQVFSSLAGQGGEKSEDAVSAPARENQAPSAQEIARSHVAYEAERQIESEAVSKDSFPSTSSEGQPEEEEEEEEKEKEEEGLEKHYAGVSHAAADMSEQGDISLPKIELSEPDHRGPGGNTRLWKNGFTDGRAHSRTGEEAAAAAELVATEGRGGGHPQTAAYNKPVIDPGSPSVSSRDPDDLLTLVPPPSAATPRHTPANNTKSLGVGGDPVPLLPRGEGSRRATHQTRDGLLAGEDQISMISTSREEYNGGDEEGEGEGPYNPVNSLPGTPDAARPEDLAGRGEADSVTMAGRTSTSQSVSSEAPPHALSPLPPPGGGSNPRQGAATATSESGKVKLDGHLPPVDAPRGEGDHSPQLPGNAFKSEGPPVMLAGTAAKNPMRLTGPLTLPGAAPLAGGGDGEPRNNPIEVSEEVTPRSGIDTSPAGQVSNGHSYPGVGGSLALPIVGAASPPDVLDDQAASETSSSDGIGINDVAAKDQRDKAAHEISLSRSNQTGEIAGEAPPPPSTHDLLAALRPPKRIESEKKQSGPKSMEASARAGYSERTESSIDTEGSEASQGRPFLSRSNQMVDDPNQESVHARVSSRDSARENRDQDAYLSGCGGHDGAAAGGGACLEDGEHRRRQGSSEGNNSWREAIEGDERDPARLPGDSLDGAMKGSLPTEHRDDEAPARRRDTPAAAPTPGPPAGVEGREAVGSDQEGENVPVGQPHHAPHSGPPSLGEGSGSNNSPLDSSGNSSQGGSSGETRGSGHSIMPYRDPRQSRDSPCKCSCQCDGGEAPPIMPGRVAANLNSEAVAGGPITPLAPSPSPTLPPPHHHRHHHQGHRGGGPHSAPPTVLSSHPTDTTTSPPSSPSSTPTPPLASPVTLRDMAPQVPNSGEDQPTSAASTTPGGGTVVRQLSYTAVSNPAVTLVVPQPSLAPDPAATRAPGTAAAIHASLVLGDDQGSQTQARPQQVAPPDGSSFSPLSLGEELAFNLAPYGYWNLHLTLNDPTDIRITLTKPRGTSLGLYARRSSLPTHTQHDVMKILREARQRDVRASPNMVEVSVEQVLEAGEWFISIYNDDGDPHQVALVINRGDGGGECPQRCHDRGHCILGRCHCHAGYSGVDCSQMLCPILCAGHGDYVSGQCKCHAGFKGKECQLRHHECEVADCNGKGQCVAGRCRCAKGFTGEFCEKVDCPHPTCSGNGWCVNGTCVCQKGWRGPDCSETDLDARQCLPDCNEHGRFDIELQRCVCNHPWTGSDCSKKSCSLDCGLHGVCENDACRCEEGWKGDNCSEKLCDARCSEHGQCKNGTCVCMTGWNGRHCTLSGCPGNCRNRGTCNAHGEDGTWSCSCENGWDGPDCSAMLETRCNDGEDNDKDGLVDCQDPECCDHRACNGSQLCVSRASSPLELLLRKQPPAATASFYEKMKFLIEDNSLQHFPQAGAFNKRRAAVVRGRVVTRAGRGVIGLRVSPDENREGFTLTRNDGMFDIMVNGGGTVNLLFGKPPFAQKTVRVMVPWNKVVVLDDIVMTVSGSNDHSASYHDHLQRRPTSHCPLHDYDLLRPIIMATWQNVFQGECPHADAILVESQAVQESIQIPGTDFYLVYHSSRANGYESTIRMQLTPDHIPATLRRVHLRIVLEGTLFTRVFEADPNIKFTYAWDRYNVYRQRVHGVTVALVSVGYEHASCPKIIWEHQTTRVAGHDLLISMVGGFNLHVHHTYNYHQGILQKGDGQNIYLAGQRRLVTTLLGTGEQREVLCGDRCEGHANEVPLLTPSCLAAAPDGSLYVGDFTLIHRVWPDGAVTTVARLNETRVSYRYHMAVSPLDGSVYVSDPEAHQVLHLGATRENLPVVVVGSGQRCLPGDKNRCGDGGQAIHARLTYPKGLAISLDGDIYIADGTNIRVVSHGIIQTIIGGHDHRSHWAPVPCNGTINMDQLHLRWPTELAISPLDGSLHILDDHLVLRVTPDNRVQVLSGRSLNCPTPPHDPPDVSRTALLLSPQSIAFSPEGELYVAESDSQRINRVRIITSDGRISLFAGAESECNCRDPTCHCHTYDNVSAASAIFFSISSIAVTPDGVLHIADQAGYRVRSVRTVLPELIDRKHYEIISPDSHEVYVFNSRGQHTETRNLVTGQTIYKFQYNSHSSVSRLWTVSDGAGNKFHIIRERGGNVNAIETPQKQLIKIHLTMTDKLEKLVAPNGYNISFTYNSLRSSGLISSKIEGLGRSFNYDYDEQGRLTRAVLPTGQVIQLNFDLSTRGAEVTVTRDGKNPVKTRVRGNTLTHTSGPMEAVADMGGEGKLRVLTAWDHKVSLERTSYRVLESTSQIAAEMFPILSRQQTHIGGSLVNRYEWIYSPASQHTTAHGMKVSATLRVNNADLLMLRYDPTTSSEALLSVSGQMLVNITYDDKGRPVLWMPVSPLVPSNVSYDHWGHIIGWTRGNLSEEYEYDSVMRLMSVTYADGARVAYDYKEDRIKPQKVQHPSGRTYGLVYDDAGSLRQVVTPRRTAYTLHVSTSLGFYRLRLALPVDNIALQVRLDEQGRILAMTQPGQGGTLLYKYDDLGRLSGELYGRGFTDYTYDEMGLIHTAKTKHNHIDVRTDYRYHAGLIKDMRLRYGSKSDLHNVRLKFIYDASARLRRVEGEINSNQLNEVIIRFDNQTGILNLISDLRIIRNNILETMLQNPKKDFVNTRIQDHYGRLAEVDMTLQGRTVYMMKLKYDNRNRISERLIEVAGRREGLNITYTPDGEILKVTGTLRWVYSYDENGNIVRNGYSEALTYDECDRVIKVGGKHVVYDDRGFVISFDNQNFEYNTKGLLVSAWDREQKWSFTLGYDHLDRVSVYRDHQNNATQIVYGRPDLPELITHLHNPHTGATTYLLYDDMNHLIAMDQPDGRYYVATDQNGTPIAIFDNLGSQIYSLVWTPFGFLVDYSGTSMAVGVGPWGRFREPQTGLVLFRGHAYHPEIQQWMTPRWGHLTNPNRLVTDVFVYRFMNNNPFVSPPGRDSHYYIDVSEWLDLYGIQVDRVLGSEYHTSTLVKPRPVVAVDDLGTSEVVSGLWCQYRACVKHLHDLSFFSNSNIQSRTGIWTGVPISRQVSIFGPGVLVSNIDSRVLVTKIGEGDFTGVVGDVIRSVLNNSIILDVSATHNGRDTFYFIKSNRNKAGEDINTLRRLSGVFNVTSSETEHGHEIRMSTPTAHLVIMYGERVQRARSRVLAELEQEAEQRAWDREAALVRMGRVGSHSWTAAEAAELEREGRVPGYVATHLHSPSRYPLLASDATNIVFKHESSRKRRKSRRKGRKKSWRQRKKVGV